ncbi:MAG: hypothetical protein GC152_01745 [Alphaproteobacteria bacterium]|nr:hypothetical protein [Alphaproteobacteria bacterium]
MKITVDIECTPEEARAFLGMPNVGPLNEMIVAEMTRRAKDNLDTLADPERLVKQWVEMSGKGFDAFQGLLAATMSATGAANKKK